MLRLIRVPWDYTPRLNCLILSSIWHYMLSWSARGRSSFKDSWMPLWCSSQLRLRIYSLLGRILSSEMWRRIQILDAVHSCRCSLGEIIHGNVRVRLRPLICSGLVQHRKYGRLIVNLITWEAFEVRGPIIDHIDLLGFEPLALRRKNLLTTCRHETFIGCIACTYEILSWRGW